MVLSSWRCFPIMYIHGLSQFAIVLLNVLCGAHFEPLSWDQAEAQASSLLLRMTQEEKYQIMRGVGWKQELVVTIPQLQKWWFVGNTAPIPRLGIPSLNMQDSAGGFRTYWPELVGTVTCWPSLLSMAATWDPDLVEDFGRALGKEFADKGANAILGPSVNVHRVARNGRNFEYISGEDPFLGSRLVKAYVKGVQSQGVFAVVKHFVLNSQETHRESVSLHADEKTLWELYYPPFQAAVDAGVSATMCSYNKVDGVKACANGMQLGENLKKNMGFRGFVQSDWWAAWNTSVEQGLDQEMPGVGKSVLSGHQFSDYHLKRVPAAALDGAVKRILAVMYRMNLFNSTRCSGPCEALMRSNVTSAAHAELARKAAAKSVVLLKNHGVLPINKSRVKTLAVIGSVAVAKPFDPSKGGQGSSLEWNKGDYYAGGGSGHVTAGYVVSALEGIQQRAMQAGVHVIASPTDDVDAAVQAASESDVAIIIAGATSGEGVDRASLALDNNADGLISAVAEKTKEIVVLVQVPGAVTMPWHNHVKGLAAMFLGGQETGSAWAAVLFGDHSPTGRLPIMIPATEADTIAPSDKSEVIYKEGMATSYRNQNCTPVFPFGHGLAFTEFKFGKPVIVPCQDEVCIQVAVENVGAGRGSSVVQLYLEFPAAASYPAPILKGFARTETLEPGYRDSVTLPLSSRDMSYWQEGAWMRASSLTAHIGASSVDIHHKLRLGGATVVV